MLELCWQGAKKVWPLTCVQVKAMKMEEGGYTEAEMEVLMNLDFDNVLW